jgi:mRNA-capping enzyme
VALVIDLTDFSYPTSSDWEALGVKLVKYPCRGLPDNGNVNSFVYETMRFVRYHQDRAQTPTQILVYSTHGYNRTGFMIVHYLLRSMICSSVAEALGVFASARPPGIYKLRYVDALFSFYNQRKPITEPVFTCPEWCAADNDDDLDLFDLSAARHTWTLSENDVLGDPIPLSQQYHMQKQCCVKLGISVNSGFDIRFPGSEPVCLDRERLGLLRENYYYLSWKADECR